VTFTTRTRGGERHHRDHGATFIELLIAVVLVGSAVVATLAAVNAVVVGTRVERDHARAQQWLQSASENVRAVVRRGCDTYTEAQIRAYYQDVVIRGAADNPTGWADSQIEVVSPVKVWDGEDYLDPYTAPESCYDNVGRFLQLVEIQVKAPDGRIIEAVEVVKRD
jgi:hypothetical protein